MKRVLIFLALYYYILCAEDNPCINYMKFANSANECSKRTVTVDKENNKCCYIKLEYNVMGKKGTIGECYEFPKAVEIDSDYVKTIVDNYIKKALVGYTDITYKDYKCSGSFIKVGFLLLALFLI